MALERPEFPPSAQGRKHAERILFQPPVETSGKKENPTDLTRRGNSNVLARFSVLTVTKPSPSPSEHNNILVLTERGKEKKKRKKGDHSILRSAKIFIKVDLERKKIPRLEYSSTPKRYWNANPMAFFDIPGLERS